MRPDDPRDFDEGYANTWLTYTLGLTNDNLIVQDWSKGPSGTSENPNLMKTAYYASLTQYLKGHLAESWELPDPLTEVWHIRKGVHFALNPNSAASKQVGGREVTSEDVKVSLKRIYDDCAGSWIYGSPIHPVDWQTPDKYTLIIKFNQWDSYSIVRTAFITYIVPPELVKDSAGKETQKMRDWHNSVGTGPYMLTDYVVGNAITFKKNPNYWEMDPNHPANRLPYAEEFKILLIPDRSTQLAALRSGKVDQLLGRTFEERTSLRQTSPQLLERQVHGAGSEWYLPCNVAPYNNIKVRQALSMAINRDTIANDFYHGAALYLAWPVLPENPEYIPLNQLPQDIKDILSYNPTKAKQLLAEAGYPNGFKMQLEAINTPPVPDLAALCQSMWQQVGLDVTLKIDEPAVFNSTLYGHKYTWPMYATWQGQFLEGNLDVSRTGYPNNHTLVSDPEYDKMANDLVGESSRDPTIRNQKAKDLVLYMLRTSYTIPLPTGNLFVFWQPWLKQYSGEVAMGYCHWWKPMAYAWVDQQLKKSLGK